MTLEEQTKMSAALARRIGRGLKKDFGATMAKQNYKGTGSKSAHRQIWCRFPGAFFDVWLTGNISLSGRYTRASRVEVGVYDGTPDEVYERIKPTIAAYLAAERAAGEAEAARNAAHA
jgi:hypothetical protein